jgi:hypothetical protein
MNNEFCCPEVKDRDDIPERVKSSLKLLRRYFYLLRSPGIDSKESIPPGSLASRYDNHISTWFLAPIDCSKIQSQD